MAKADLPSTAKIDPTTALLRLLPKLTPHKAAAHLTLALHSNDCRLWCNGNLLPPEYIATALRLTAVSEVDGRWRGEIVSAVREAWEPGTYVFELDETEVAALLPAVPAPQPSADGARVDVGVEMPRRGATERWVYEQMKTDRPQKGDHGYVKRLWDRRKDKTIKKKTIGNLVGRYPAELEVPAKVPRAN